MGFLDRLALADAGFRRRVISHLLDKNPMWVHPGMSIDRVDEFILRKEEIFRSSYDAEMESGSFHLPTGFLGWSSPVNAYMVTSTTVAPASGLAFFDGRVFAESGSPWHLQPQHASHLQLPRLLRKNVIEELAFGSVFAVGAVGAFYHFLVEQLPRILAIWKLDPDLVVLMGQKPPGWVVSALEVVGVPWIMCTEQLVGPQSVWVADHSPRVRPNLEELEIVRGVYLGLLQKSGLQRTGPEKIFVSRKAYSRSPQWENDLSRFLEQRGFYIYEGSGEIPWMEQVALFSSAKVIVGIQGAGLVNSIFMPEGSLVVEAFHTEGFGPGIAPSLRQLGLRVVTFRSTNFVSMEDFLEQLPDEILAP